MGYFKEQLIDAECKLDKLGESFVREMALFLSEFCDESPHELIEIWKGCWLDCQDDMDADFDASVWSRPDCFYANQLFDALKGFVIISMENDW